LGVSFRTTTFNRSVWKRYSITTGADLKEAMEVSQKFQAKQVKKVVAMKR
jgi:hypothetical protein